MNKKSFSGISNQINFSKLSKAFRKESRQLQLQGFSSWESIKELNDVEISNLIKLGCGSIRNLKCLRCIAIFICELEILQEEASLLLHSGIPSINALASLMPQELINKTARLEIILGTGRRNNVNLAKASIWIKKAKIYSKIHLK